MLVKSNGASGLYSRMLDYQRPGRDRHVEMIEQELHSDLVNHLRLLLLTLSLFRFSFPGGKN